MFDRRDKFILIVILIPTILWIIAMLSIRYFLIEDISVVPIIMIVTIGWILSLILGLAMYYNKRYWHEI